MAIQDNTVLNDREIAVVIDSLAMMRDKLKTAGAPAPNVESALSKFVAQVTPSTWAITLVPTER